jgi:DNA-binding response OmpR family regulator
MVPGRGGALPSPTVPDILLATDADWLYEEVDATLADSHTTIRRVRRGVDVIPAVQAKQPDLIIVDLQIGNMGGMATCHGLRLEESAGRLPHLNVLMLLDRDDDLFLARRAAADGWLIKPIDGFRLRKAARALLAGDTWFEARRQPV